VKGLQATGLTDRGKVRNNNEDRFLIIDDEVLHLIAVADGMGGHAAGEIASSLAVESVRSYLAEKREDIIDRAKDKRPLSSFLKEMLSYANAVVYSAGEENPEYAGMGTTMTLVLSAAGSDWLAHIGDSRAYLLRNNHILSLTEDHTLVAQLVKTGEIQANDAGKHPQRHILTRALGTDKKACFDIKQLALQPKDRLILCTDGLHGYVDEPEILSIAARHNDREEIVRLLVAKANEKGGMDNITVIVAEKE
jgi:protein phosphatase